MPEGSASSTLRIQLGGQGCALPQPISSRTTPFALLVERGDCSFDDKMATAVVLGASALIVSDSLRGEYRMNDEQHQSTATMALLDPCAVDCTMGSGYIDAQTTTVVEVLDGLSGSCGGSCETCAFSGRSTDSMRQVCCFKDVTIDMALPRSIANHTVIPAVFIARSQVAFRQAIRLCEGVV